MVAKRESTWTAKEFIDWMDRLYFNDYAAATALGVSDRMIRGYTSGTTPISLMCQCACRWIEHSGVDDVEQVNLSGGWTGAPRNG